MRHRVLTALLLLTGSLLPATATRAEIVRHTFELFPIAPGVTILFDTNQLHGMGSSGDSYTTRIQFDEAYGDLVIFTWSMYDYLNQPSSSFGTSIVEDIQSCRYLDPWWPGGNTPREILESRCELWISRDTLADLHRTGRAFFQPDFYVRKDEAVELVLEETTAFEVDIDGVPHTLPALRLRSSMNDVFIVYDNPDNPFVLEAMLPGIYEWSVSDIHINTTPPPILGYSTTIQR